MTHTDFLYEFVNTADDFKVQMERIQSSLQLLDEGLGEEVQFLSRSDDCYAKHFVSRYSLFSGLLDMTISSLYDYRKEFSARCDALWTAYKKEASECPTA